MKSERHIAITIQEEVIVKSTEETNLCSLCCVILAEVLKILVAESNCNIESVIETTEHRVALVYCIDTERIDTCVTPTADCLVSGEFVRVPQLAVVTRGTAVNTVNVAVTIGTCLSCKCHNAITFVQQRVRTDFISSLKVRVDWSYVQVSCTRRGTQSKCQCCCREYIFNRLFHKFQSS